MNQSSIINELILRHEIFDKCFNSAERRLFEAIKEYQTMKKAKAKLKGRGVGQFAKESMPAFVKESCVQH